MLQFSASPVRNKNAREFLMKFFSRFLNDGQPRKGEIEQQLEAETQAEGRRLIDLSIQFLSAMEYEQRLAAFVERYRKQGHQDRTVLEEWHNSRNEVDRIFTEYAAAFERYRIAAVSAAPNAKNSTSRMPRVWGHPSTI